MVISRLDTGTWILPDVVQVCPRPGEMLRFDETLVRGALHVAAMGYASELGERFPENLGNVTSFIADFREWIDTPGRKVRLRQ